MGRKINADAAQGDPHTQHLADCEIHHRQHQQVSEQEDTRESTRKYLRETLETLGISN